MSYENPNLNEVADNATLENSNEESVVNVEEEAIINEINEKLLEIDNSAKEIAQVSEDKIKEALTKESFVNKLKDLGEITASLGLMVAGFGTLVSSVASEVSADSVVPTIGVACMAVGSLVGKYLIIQSEKKAAAQTITA